jgi:colanic acid/amylovoran biosynthesis glycosyltransferase
MKIALITHDFPKLSETFIVNHFLGLLGQGLEVRVVCGRSEQREWQRFPQLNGQRARVKPSWPHRSKFLASLLLPFAFSYCLLCNPRGTLKYLRCAPARFGWNTLRRFYLDAPLIAFAPDLIHFEFGTLAAKQVYLRELLDCAVVASFRGYDLNYVALERADYYQEVWQQADALHLLGEDLWRRAQQRGCPADKFHLLIPPALDAARFEPQGKTHCDLAGTPERPLKILSVGRLEWKKGYEFALEAVRLLEQQGIHCHYQIIGAGAFFEALAFARHQMGLDEQVELLGALPPAQVKEHLRAADVFLHAAVSEGFCNAVLEAQAMQTPVVCSDADGLAENVLDGVTGFVVPRRQPSLMAEKLAQLAGDPALRERMGQAGRARVNEHFQPAQQLQAFLDLYAQALQNRHPNRSDARQADLTQLSKPI